MILKNRNQSKKYDARSTNVEGHLYGAAFGSSRSKKKFSFKTLRTSYFVVIMVLAVSIILSNTGCGIYRFHDVSVVDSIKTVKVNLFDNKARYVNVQLCPRLT